MFTLFFLFFTIYFFSKTRQQTKTKIGRKGDPYLEGIEAKFPQDVEGFWRKGQNLMHFGFPPIGLTVLGAMGGLTLGPAHDVWL